MVSFTIGLGKKISISFPLLFFRAPLQAYKGSPAMPDRNGKHNNMLFGYGKNQCGMVIL